MKYQVISTTVSFVSLLKNKTLRFHLPLSIYNNQHLKEGIVLEFELMIRKNIQALSGITLLLMPAIRIFLIFVEAT